MTADYQKLVEEIARRIATVADIGRVHIQRFHVIKDEDWRTLLFDENQGRYHAWSVTRENFTSEHVGTGGMHERECEFVIRGYLTLYYPLDTDLLFKRLQDRIAAKLAPPTRLGGLIEEIFPVQCRADTLAVFGGVICHYCELTFRVREYVQFQPEE